jgi:Protein of unknown function (DUF3795)
MNVRDTKLTAPINQSLIAPCGMNCGLCIGHLREKRPCPGCNGEDANKPKHCFVCRIKYCDEKRSNAQQFCFDCTKFPCTRLRQLDERYRTKYSMSMIENLEMIQKLGLEAFVAHEVERWKCPECGGVICVHREKCIYCDHSRNYYP